MEFYKILPLWIFVFGMCTIVLIDSGIPRSIFKFLKRKTKFIKPKYNKQLPDGMQDCTIIFKSCPVGHGTLTAKNWVQHECQRCRILELEGEIKLLRNGT